MIDAAAARNAVCLVGRVRCDDAAHLLTSHLEWPVEDFVVKEPGANFLLDAKIAHACNHICWQIEVSSAPKSWKLWNRHTRALGWCQRFPGHPRQHDVVPFFALRML